MYDRFCLFSIFFFFNDTATTEIYTLSLHDALPIYRQLFRSGVVRARLAGAPVRSGRSEEHTSELQSHSDLVCRLLLEKKKEIDAIAIPVFVHSQGCLDPAFDCQDAAYDYLLFFFFNDTATTEIYTLSLHDALPICYCNITKCCTKVCPEHITITDNAIIPLKERVVDEYYDPLGWLWKKLRPKS